MTTLAQYERVRAALAKATSVHDILAIGDEVEHVKLYAKQIQDRTLLADAYEYQLRVERRLGEVLTAGKAVGYFREGRPKKNGSGGEPFSGATLAEAGVDKKLSARAQKRSGIAEEAFELMVRTMRERMAADDADPINGARALMGSRVEPGDSLDYFPTPPWAARALMRHVLPAAGFAGKRFGSVWEPACGEGHIAEVLAEYADKVYATDIHDYGYGATDSDFLDINTDRDTDWIVTNPPFGDKTEAFVLRAIEQARVGVAMFVRLQWLESVGRYENVFCDHPPTIIAFFAERVNLCKGRWEPEGTTATAYIWLVWIKGAAPRAPFWIPPGCRKVLTKPDDSTRFTTHPVMKADRVVCDEQFNSETGEITDPAMTAPPPAQAPLPRDGALSCLDEEIEGIPAFLKVANRKSEFVSPRASPLDSAGRVD